MSVCGWDLDLFIPRWLCCCCCCRFLGRLRGEGRALWRYEQRNVYGAIQKPCERSYGQLDAEFVTFISSAHRHAANAALTQRRLRAIGKMAASHTHTLVSLSLMAFSVSGELLAACSPARAHDGRLGCCCSLSEFPGVECGF